MQVGPAHWKCVTTDSAGVPHGGRYGNVEWFETQANKVGLKIAWSQTVSAFGIYTVLAGGRHVWQLLLRQFGDSGWGDPVPMNHQLLVCLTRLREEDCRHGHTIMQGMALREKHRRDDLISEWDRADEDMREEVVRKVGLRIGMVTPTVAALPKRVQIYAPRAERRRRMRARRKAPAGRIILL